jgi:ATP-binding cassette subfamily B (MDR/TAP) protein 1
MMSLIFGNLTQDFVNFGSIIHLHSIGQATAAQVAQAAAQLRSTAAKDASYLVCIGKLLVPH